jgi:GNAT superfamily N-acetyltransferase
MTTLFATGRHVVRPACAFDGPALEAFAAQNPGYDILLSGAAPEPHLWVEEFMESQPPREFGWSAVHKLVAIPQDGGPVAAVMDICEDMIAPGVGHVGLFQVAEALHGTGIAQELYEALEAWLAGRGSDAVRLGVLLANPRGRAFWVRNGYQVSRLREAPSDAPVAHTAEVMVKFLSTPASLEAWWTRVPRDRPDPSGEERHADG